MTADAAGDVGLQLVSGSALAISDSLCIIVTKGMYNTGRMLVSSEGAFVAGGTGAITLVLAFTQNAATSEDSTFYNGWMSVDEVG